LLRRTRRVYGYFNNHFRWQVRKGADKGGYPGAEKNLIEFMEMLRIASEKHREELERINKWRLQKRGLEWGQ